MKHLHWIVLALTALLSPSLAQEAYKDTLGDYKVSQRDETWRDEARKRDVPVRIYTPTIKEESPEPAGRGKPGKFPVIVYSHGLGGSREVGAYLAKHLASHGYLVISPTHAGSDTEALRERARERVRENIRERRPALRRNREPAPNHDPEGRQELMEYLKDSTSDPDNLRDRPRDITFVLDHVAKDEKLSPVADLTHVGVMGHSFGAYTAFAVAGMTIDLPDENGGPNQSFRDERVKAVVAMSPQGVGVMGITAKSWDKVAIPVLSLTGTKDYGQNARAAAWRREAFDSTKGVPAMLVVIRDATHGTFSDFAGGRLTGESSGKDHAKHIRYIKMVTTAYFDANVLGHQGASNWLKSDNLSTFDDGACAVERKDPAADPGRN
ncbi:MAG: hypothetical protein KF678_06100 [Phycisphaeraceae bacterium]|nr:hypothetical protein [Phycisphaeraceae bacterium]